MVEIVGVLVAHRDGADHVGERVRGRGPHRGGRARDGRGEIGCDLPPLKGLKRKWRDHPNATSEAYTMPANIPRSIVGHDGRGLCDDERMLGLDTG